jgi:hypothetical protein
MFQRPLAFLAHQPYACVLPWPLFMPMEVRLYLKKRILSNDALQDRDKPELRLEEWINLFQSWEKLTSVYIFNFTQLDALLFIFLKGSDL